ncbi:hypothetical protein B0H11DRAFT_1724079 [Mycena galericulata]|nr:hypothetical protein B0H11DRAFT_1724079 [Mycena galericulata]
MPELCYLADGKIVVIWRHHESIFYANDRRKNRWVHFSETAKPKAKGEGVSMMVIAFVTRVGRLSFWVRDGCVTNRACQRSQFPL